LQDSGAGQFGKPDAESFLGVDSGAATQSVAATET